jgi:hypothetical protein
MKIMDDLELIALFTEMSNCGSDSDVLCNLISCIFTNIHFVTCRRINYH